MNFCQVASSSGFDGFRAGFDLVQLFSDPSVAISSAGWSFGRELTGFVSHKSKSCEVSRSPCMIWPAGSSKHTHHSKNAPP